MEDLRLLLHMASDRSTSISLTGGKQPVSVSCNNSTGRRMPVFITPLSTNTPLQPRQLQNLLSNQVQSSVVPPDLHHQPAPVKKVLLKAVKKKGNKSDSKVFSLRNVNLSAVKSINRLKGTYDPRRAK